jgi:hypothetical protein
MLGDPPGPKPPLEPYEWLMPLAPWERPEVVQGVLASLSAQSWPAHRLVVSVDGVLPQSLRDVLVASGLPLLVLEAEAWQGTGAVLARGFAACTTRWVLRSDADDRSHPRRAELQLRHLAANPALAVLGTQLAEQRGPHARPDVRRVPLADADIRRLIQWRNPINHPTVALRRDAILAAGNYRACPLFEDWDLWLRLAVRGSMFANLSETLVTAAVGEAHLARRHGRHYVSREARFLMRCGCEKLMPWHQVLNLCILRLPWRILPLGWLAALMAWLRCRS